MDGLYTQQSTPSHNTAHKNILKINYLCITKGMDGLILEIL